MKECKFCKRFKEEIKIDKKGITVQNMYDIMKLSIEALNNADCNIECWLNEDIFLGCDFHISHFNAIPDIVLSFENEEVKKMQEQLSQLQQEKEELINSLESVNNEIFQYKYLMQDILDVKIENLSKFVITTTDTTSIELVRLLKEVAEFRKTHYIEDKDKIIILVPENYINKKLFKPFFEESDKDVS
jgi:hypothetical protein